MRKVIIMALVAIAPVMTAWSQQVIFDKMLDKKLAVNKDIKSVGNLSELSKEIIPAKAILNVPSGNWSYVYSSLPSEKGIPDIELKDIIKDQARKGLLNERGNLFAVNDVSFRDNKVGYFVFVSKKSNNWFVVEVEFGDTIKPNLGAVLYTRK